MNGLNGYIQEDRPAGSAEKFPPTSPLTRKTKVAGWTYPVPFGPHQAALVREGLAPGCSCFVGPLCFHAPKTCIMGTMTEDMEEFMEQHKECIIPPFFIEQSRMKVDHINQQFTRRFNGPPGHTVPLSSVGAENAERHILNDREIDRPEHGDRMDFFKNLASQRF